MNQQTSDLAPSALGVAAVFVALVAFVITIALLSSGITGCRNACGDVGVAEWVAATGETPQRCRCIEPDAAEEED